MNLISSIPDSVTIKNCSIAREQRDSAMNTIPIVLIDDDKDFLTIGKEFLEDNRGITVETALEEKEK